MLKKSKSYFQLSKLSQYILLEEADPIRLMLISVSSIALLLFALLLWAAFTTVNEMATTYGEIVPLGPKHVVQHLEGGIVKTVFVKDGDQVEQGQLLMVMDPEAYSSDLKQMQSREISLMLNETRLQAYIDHKEPNLEEWRQTILRSPYDSFDKQQLEKMIQNEYALLKLQNEKRNDQKAVITAQIGSAKKEIAQLEKDKKVLDENLKLYDQEYNMYQKLSGKDIISKRDFLIVQRRLNTARGEESQLDTKTEKAKQDLAEAQSRLSEVESNLHEQASQELNNTHNELLQVRHAIAKAQDKVNRLEIKSPVAGTIKGLRVARGSVVVPGGELLDIVPKDRELVVENKISTRDIGHIKVGDAVKVKIMTYDFARYGSLEGKLTDISASTFTDAEGVPYYKGTIQLFRDQSGKNGITRLLPGMTVEADIITGERSLLTYLLTPIEVSVKSSFRER